MTAERGEDIPSPQSGGLSEHDHIGLILSWCRDHYNGEVGAAKAIRRIEEIAERAAREAIRVPVVNGFVDARCGDPAHKDDGVYQMVGSCSNCGAKAILGMFTTGHETSAYGPCPLCGVRYRLGWNRLATPDEIPVTGTLA